MPELSFHPPEPSSGELRAAFPQERGRFPPRNCLHAVATSSLYGAAGPDTNSNWSPTVPEIPTLCGQRVALGGGR